MCTFVCVCVSVYVAILIRLNDQCRIIAFNCVQTILGDEPSKGHKSV